MVLQGIDHAGRFSFSIVRLLEFCDAVGARPAVGRPGSMRLLTGAGNRRLRLPQTSPIMAPPKKSAKGVAAPFLCQ